MPPAKTRAGRARQRSKPDAHSVSPTALAGHPGPNALRVLRLSELTPAPYNPRKISDKALAGLQESLKKFGLVQPIITNKRTGHVVGGHARIAALMKNGAETAECLEVDLSEADELALNITLNNPNIAGEFTDDLQALLDQLHSSSPDMVSPLNLNDLWNGSAFAQGATDQEQARRTLAERFGVPPFSVLDARQGYWQDRKRAWIALGIASEIGRGENLLQLSAACNLQQKGKAYK